MWGGRIRHFLGDAVAKGRNRLSDAGRAQPPSRTGPRSQPPWPTPSASRTSTAEPAARCPPPAESRVAFAAARAAATALAAATATRAACGEAIRRAARPRGAAAPPDPCRARAARSAARARCARRAAEPPPPPWAAARPLLVRAPKMRLRPRPHRSTHRFLHVAQAQKRVAPSSAERVCFSSQLTSCEPQRRHLTIAW